MVPSINRPSPSFFENPLRGMRQAIEQTNTAAEKIAEGDVSPENIVATMEARIMFKANATVLKVEDQMLGSLLNTKA